MLQTGYHRNHARLRSARRHRLVRNRFCMV